MNLFPCFQGGGTEAQYPQFKITKAFANIYEASTQMPISVDMGAKPSILIAFDITDDQRSGVSTDYTGISVGLLRNLGGCYAERYNVLTCTDGIITDTNKQGTWTADPTAISLNDTGFIYNKAINGKLYVIAITVAEPLQCNINEKENSDDLGATVEKAFYFVTHDVFNIGGNGIDMNCGFEPDLVLSFSNSAMDQSFYSYTTASTAICDATGGQYLITNPVANLNVTQGKIEITNTGFSNKTFTGNSNMSLAIKFKQ